MTLSSRKDVPFLSVPTCFHRCDNINFGVLRSELLHEDGQHATLGVMSKGCYESRDMVLFNMVDSFPTKPDSQILKKMKVKYVSDEQLQKVKKVRIDLLIFIVTLHLTVSLHN